MASTAILKTGYGEAFDKEYDALPASIKLIYSPREFAWIEPSDRARVIEQETMPEVAED